MLYLDIKRAMRLRGVDNHYDFMIKLGFVPLTAKNFLSGAARLIKLDQIERLCLALNCTPNDLLEWRAPENQANPEAQALIKLKRGGADDLANLMNKLPMEQFEQIVNILQDLKDKQA
jgi:DNA-binding Xre family transcriptional regulator